MEASIVVRLGYESMGRINHVLIITIDADGVEIWVLRILSKIFTLFWPRKDVVTLTSR